MSRFTQVDCLKLSALLDGKYAVSCGVEKSNDSAFSVILSTFIRVTRLSGTNEFAFVYRLTPLALSKMTDRDLFLDSLAVEIAAEFDIAQKNL